MEVFHLTKNVNLFYVSFLHERPKQQLTHAITFYSQFKTMNFVILQSLKLTNWNSQTKVEEIQDVDVTSDAIDRVTFRLGLYGVFTGKFRMH